MEKQVWLASSLVVLLLAMGSFSASPANAIQISVFPVVSNGFITGYTFNVVSNSIPTGNTIDYGTPISFSFNNLPTNVAVSNTVASNGIFYSTPVFPTISQTINLTSCNQTSTIFVNTIKITEIAPKCFNINVQRTFSVGNQSFVYTNNTSGGFIKINAIPLLVQQNKIVNLPYNGAYTMPSINLTVLAPAIPRWNYNATIVPSFTSTFSIINTSLGINIIVDRIQPINKSLMLNLGGSFVNKSLGLNISVIKQEDLVFNWTALQQAYDNKYLASCNTQYKYTSNVIICLDSANATLIGDITNNHNISEGITKAVLDIRNNDKIRFDTINSSYNNLIQTYNQVAQYNRTNTNIISNFNLAAQTNNSYIEYGGLLAGSIFLGYVYLKRKGKLQFSYFRKGV